MRVLSLFDGMSCGQIALRELGIVPQVYYASEVDKFAIAQTALNFPDTVHLGDVRGVDTASLGHIDLLIGGSPCQSFSFAGKRKGMSTVSSEEVYTLERYMQLKAEGFEFEGQSYLFWEYMRILTELRRTSPSVLFLLENVEMGKKWERVLSDAIGVRGVHINSALVSAQVRKRIYWTNIRTKQIDMFGTLASDIPQPEDRGIFLRDILQPEVNEKYFLKPAVVEKLLIHRERNREKGNGFGAVFHSPEAKMACIKIGGAGVDNLVCISSTQAHATVQSDKSTPLVAAAGEGGGHIPMILQRGRGYNAGGVHEEKSPSLTSHAWEQNNIIVHLNNANEFGKQPRQQNRVYDANFKSPALMNGNAGNTYNIMSGSTIRKITPTECARLQTIPEWYRWECSETQQYRMLGNGWTVEVIKHILSFLPEELKKNNP